MAQLTFTAITNLMLSTEKLINDFNEKWGFDYSFVLDKEIAAHESNLSLWDKLKEVRNNLKWNKHQGATQATATIDGIEWVVDLTK